MPKNPRPGPLVYVEIEVNYRWRRTEPECCYLTVIEQRSAMHRRIAHTEHIVASGERLIDLVNERYLELTREYVLTWLEPF